MEHVAVAQDKGADAEPPRTWRQRVRKLFVPVGGLLAVLLALELILWALGSYVSWGLRPPSTDAESGARVFTILCVGDSWTQGAPSGRYCEFLVDRLNSRQDELRFRQVNVGRAGTNSSQALRRLPEQIRQYRPDLLLVMTGNNDHHNLSESTYWRFKDESLGWGSIAAARIRASMHSLRVYRLARATWQKASGGPTANEFFIMASDGPTADRADLIAIDPATHRRQLEYNLTRFVELARLQGLPLVFQTYFHFHGYRVNEIIRDVASTHGIPLADHNHLFHTRVPPEQRQSLRIADGHPNPRGYELIADHVVEVLDANDLIP